MARGTLSKRKKKVITQTSHQVIVLDGALMVQTRVTKGCDHIT